MSWPSFWVLCAELFFQRINWLTSSNFIRLSWCFQGVQFYTRMRHFYSFVKTWRQSNFPPIRIYPTSQFRNPTHKASSAYIFFSPANQLSIQHFCRHKLFAAAGRVVAVESKCTQPANHTAKALGSDVLIEIFAGSQNVLIDPLLHSSYLDYLP